MLLFLVACHGFHYRYNEQCDNCSKRNAGRMMHGWKFESHHHARRRHGSKGPRKTGDVAKGKVLFQNHCAKCHGDSAKGDGPLAKEMDPKPSDLTANNWFHKRHFFFMVSEGTVSGMPAWKDVLSDEDMWNVISYVQTL